MLRLLRLGQMVCVEGRVCEGLFESRDGAAAVGELVAGLAHDLLIERPGRPRIGTRGCDL